MLKDDLILKIDENIFFNVDKNKYVLDGFEQEKEVTIGVRSEDIYLSNEGLPIVVNLVEMLGSEVLIHSTFENTNINFVIKTPERVNLTNGSKAHVQFKQEKIHLFDKESQMSLLRR